MLALALAFLLSAAPGGATPAALTPEERDRAVESYLGTIDRPVGDDAWRALGPDAVPALARVARDPTELPTRRALALEGLAALGGDEAQATHLAVLRGTRTPRLVRHGAIRGLGRLLPADRLAREVRPLLTDRDAGVRVTAAEVLAVNAPARACAAIRAQAAKEGGATKVRFAKALERCSR